jgi:hypothetical protein
MKGNLKKKLKLKKILINNNRKIIDLFYLENDFYYSVIYHPKKNMWEPNNDSASPESLCCSSIRLEELEHILFLRSSLKTQRENYRIFKKNENYNKQENKIFNISELKNKIC